MPWQAAEQKGIVANTSAAILLFTLALSMFRSCQDLCTVPGCLLTSQSNNHRKKHPGSLKDAAVQLIKHLPWLTLYSRNSRSYYCMSGTLEVVCRVTIFTQLTRFQLPILSLLILPTELDSDKAATLDSVFSSMACAESIG